MCVRDNHAQCQYLCCARSAIPTCLDFEFFPYSHLLRLYTNKLLLVITIITSRTKNRFTHTRKLYFRFQTPTVQKTITFLSLLLSVVNRPFVDGYERCKRLKNEYSIPITPKTVFMRVGRSETRRYTYTEPETLLQIAKTKNPSAVTASLSPRTKRNTRVNPHRSFRPCISFAVGE